MNAADETRKSHDNTNVFSVTEKFDKIGIKEKKNRLFQNPA